MNNALSFSIPTSQRLPRTGSSQTSGNAFAFATLLLGLCLAQAASAQTASALDATRHPGIHPLSFVYDSINMAHFCGPTLLCIDAVGTAEVPHLGKSTLVYQGRLDFSTIDQNTGCGPNPGIVTITAANGDTLVLVLGGEHCPSTPDAPLGLTSGDFTVSGGTGRFANATGGGIYTDIQTSSNPDFTGADTAQFEGTLSY